MSIDKTNRATACSTSPCAQSVVPTSASRTASGHELEKKKLARRYDFARLKQHVTMRDVLIHYGFDRVLRRSGRELVGPCPLPEHTGDRSNHCAFSVEPDRGVWRCFSSCGGGDVVELVRRAERSGHAHAARVLAVLADGMSPDATVPRAEERADPLTENTGFVPYTRSLRLWPDHPLLRSKGIRSDTARLFEAGGWPGGGFLERCIGVRLHDPCGRPLGYTGRRVNTGEAAQLGKWKLPPRFPKSGVLYGYHRARVFLGAGLVVVEGPFDAMRVHQAGHPNVVALLGTGLSPKQRDLLWAAPQIVLLLDGDPTGRAAAHLLAAMLAPTPVRLVQLGRGNPADLADEDLHHAVASALRRPMSAPRTT